MKLAIPPIPTQPLNFGLVSWLVTDLVLIHPFRLFVEKSEFGGFKRFPAFKFGWHERLTYTQERASG